MSLVVCIHFSPKKQIVWHANVQIEASVYLSIPVSAKMQEADEGKASIAELSYSQFQAAPICVYPTERTEFRMLLLCKRRYVYEDALRRVGWLI